MARETRLGNEVIYVPTGWRIVGIRAGQIAERVVSDDFNRLTEGPVENTLYAVQCTLPRFFKGRPTVEQVLDAITEEVRLTWEECPRLTRDEGIKRSPSRYGGLWYEIAARPGNNLVWVGEVIWRSAHPVVTGAPITTRVLLEEHAAHVQLSVRVTADGGLASVRGYIGAGQAQPSFLRPIARDIPLEWFGAPFRVQYVSTREGEVERLVRDVIASEERAIPVAVLTPLEEGGYAVDPGELLIDLLGRAVLYVLREHKQTFALTNAVGDRRMSCYWGAVRVYMPGWDKHDNPYAHPLLVSDRLTDPVMKAAWLGEIGIWLGTRITLPPPLGERKPPESVVSSTNGGLAREHEVIEDGTGSLEVSENTQVAEADPASFPSAAAAETSEPADVTTELRGEDRVGVRDSSAVSGAALVTPQIVAPGTAVLFERLFEEVRTLGCSISDLVDEVERLRTLTAVRSAGTSAIERRLGHVEAILQRMISDMQIGAGAIPGDQMDVGFGFEEDEEPDEESLTLVDVVRTAAEAYSDALVFLDSAYESASESPYESPDRVQAVLDAMARIARRRQDGVLGMSLRSAFSELGIDYRSGISRTTPERLREQYRFNYRGLEFEAEEHIALGNTYDPRRCLRIYFSSRVPNELRFVIAHVGRHFTVTTTT